MKRTLSSILLIWINCCVMFAQQYEIKGKLIDAQTSEPVELATALLLRTDSSRVGGVMTNQNGQFILKTSSVGNYLVKLSYVGFQTQYKNVQIEESKPVYDLGILKLGTNENILGTATVTATAAKVEQVEDTTMFNAAAYRVAEGSTLEALVKQLPGVEIEDDGTISWNGKKIKEFLVNGKDFFKGQADLAMQNLPADWVSRIKAYEKKSEYAEQTGIDDGEEFAVLDIMTKRELNRTLIANSDLSYGSEDRYFGKLFLSHLTDHSRVSAYGSMNNVSDKSFGGKRKRLNGGLVARKNAGMDFFWENEKGKREGGRLELGGNFNYNHASTDMMSKSETEYFRGGGATSSFHSGYNQSLASSTYIDSHFRLIWNPDSMTNITFRPSFSHNDSRNSGGAVTATFRKDPFDIEGMQSPLDSLLFVPMTGDESHTLNADLDSIAVNCNRRNNIGDRESNAVNGSLNIVRRLNSKGRNVSLALMGGYSRNESHGFSVSNIYYFSGRPGKYLNQYNTTPSDRWNYRIQLGYVEPIAKNWFAELRYAYSNKYTESTRSRFNLDKIDPIYGAWCDTLNYPPLGTLPQDIDVLMGVRDSSNSQAATYRYFDHTVNFNIRYNTKAINFSAGVNINPEKTKMAYERPGQNIDTVITRHVFNVAPQMYFRYRINKQNTIEARYRGVSSQPSMTDLIAVVDNSHPLNVNMGNPSLDPSWTNSFDLGFRGYQSQRQQGSAVGLNFTHVKNAVSHLSVYDESTGVRYHRPSNINGNWNVRLNLMYNVGLGKQKNFTISTNTNLLYNNAVGFVSSFSSGANSDIDPENHPSNYGYYDEIFANANIQKNTTKTVGVRERLKLAYRKRWLEIGTFGSVNYNHSEADKRKHNDRDTWNFYYGLNTDLKFDWGLSLATDIRVNSRRGYPNATMNTDEWLWNAQLAYSFLKRKAATISFQCYDILRQQSNVSHSISATRRSDSWNNDIHSYYMVHFIYKFRHIGGKGKKDDKKSKWKGKHESILDDGSIVPQGKVE